LLAGNACRDDEKPLQGEPVPSLIRELWAFMLARKKFWLLPIIVIMVLLGGLMVLTPSVIAPFMYTIY
jgi:uncharacterized protein DUF5989